MVPTSNVFTVLGDFHVTSGVGIDLNPEISNTVVLPDTSNNDEEDEEFNATLGIIHHNPNVNFDADMSMFSSEDEACSNNSKSRKREDMEAFGFQPFPLMVFLMWCFFVLYSMSFRLFWGLLAVLLLFVFSFLFLFRL